MPHLVGIDRAALCKHIDRFATIAANIQINGLAPHRRSLAELLSCRDGPTILHLAYTAAVRDGLDLFGDLHCILAQAGRLLSGRGGDPVAIGAAAKRLLAALCPRGRGARAHRRRGRPRQRDFDPRAAQAYRLRHEACLTLRQIGNELGVSHTTARNWVRAVEAVAGRTKPRGRVVSLASETSW